MKQETVIYSHPFTGETEVVIKDSPRHIELRDKLHSIGLWEDNNPDKPEGCIPFSEYMESEEYKNRKEIMLKRIQNK